MIYYRSNTLPILNNLNINIPSGSITVLVGKLGSGRSIILNILTKFYKLDKRKCHIRTCQFDSTVKENIIYRNQGIYQILFIEFFKTMNL